MKSNQKKHGGRKEPAVSEAVVMEIQHAANALRDEIAEVRKEVEVQRAALAKREAGIVDAENRLAELAKYLQQHNPIAAPGGNWRKHLGLDPQDAPAPSGAAG